MIIFSENFLGFLVQFLPCVLMIFVPFPQEAYRYRRKSIFACITAVSAVIAAVFSAVLCLRNVEKYPQHVVISNFFMLAAILLALAAYIFLVRESLMKKLLVFFVVLFYAIAEFVTVNGLFTVIFPNAADTTLYPYTPKFLALYLLFTAVMLPVVMAAVIEPLKEYISLIGPENVKREFCISALSTLVYFAIIIYCDTSFGKIGSFHYFLPPMLILTINQMLIFWLLFRESVRRKRDSDERQTIEIQQLQYDKIVSDMEKTRRMIHDMRHHYNTLNDMLDRGQQEEMKNYLSQVIDTTVSRDNVVYCGNIIINGLLQYYIAVAKDEGIRCSVHAECGETAIEPVDLTVLFGNAMENAIFACRKCPQDRWIDIQIGRVQGSLAIEISNSCNEVRLNRRYQAEDGFSPAEAFISEHTGESYGLRSISHTARKYDGSAAFRFNAEKKTFIARIRLNIQDEI